MIPLKRAGSSINCGAPSSDFGTSSRGFGAQQCFWRPTAILAPSSDFGVQQWFLRAQQWFLASSCGFGAPTSDFGVHQWFWRAHQWFWRPAVVLAHSSVILAHQQWFWRTQQWFWRVQQWFWCPAVPFHTNQTGRGSLHKWSKPVQTVSEAGAKIRKLTFIHTLIEHVYREITLIRWLIGYVYRENHAYSLINWICL